MFAKSLMALMALMLSAVCAQTTSVQSIYNANTGIAMWINPNALVGITVTLMFFWVCYCVLGMLAQVQTPRIMLEKTIDWGKVERVEE